MKADKKSPQNHTGSNTPLTIPSLTPQIQSPHLHTPAVQLIKLQSATSTPISPCRRKSGDYPRRKSLGYPKKGSSDYKGSISSDEVRKRRFELEQKRREELQKSQGFSPECYLLSIASSAVLAVILITCTVFAFRVPYPEDSVISHPLYAHETMRRATMVLTDNLDCSLYMKRQIMQQVKLREVILAGLQCLFVNEPHSVAPDSAISMMFYFRQDRESARNMERYGTVGATCRMGNNNNNCTQFSFVDLHTSRVDLSSLDFMHKGFNTEWVHDDEMFNKNYKFAFKKLARFEDSGYQNPFPQAMTTKEYERADLPNELGETRIFRISKLMEKMLNYSKKNKFLRFSYDYKTMFQVNETTKWKDKIVVTKSLARYVVNSYLYQTQKRKALVKFASRIRLRAPNGKLALIPHILYPKGATHSIFSAFIVKTIFDYYQNGIFNGKTFTRTSIMAAIMKAQRLAYHFFVFSKEWTGDPNGISMMARTSVAVKFMDKPLPKTLYRPIRKDLDRSASIILWNRGNQDELHVIGLSLPKPFDSRHIHGEERGAFTRFVVESNGRTYESVNFTSHASLILTEELNQDHETDHPQFVASCSGSVRNAEAVATAILMQMIFQDSPGMAVWNSSVFIDVRDGKVYCDYDGNDKDERYKKNIMTFYEAAQKESGLKCSPIRAGDVMAKDRILMLASRPGFTVQQKKRDSILNPNQYMTGAIDSRADDYNYAMNNLRLRLVPIARISLARSAVAVCSVHTTTNLLKIHKTEKKKILHSAGVSAEENVFVQGAVKEMDELEAIMKEEVNRHFSLQVDLRTYEDVIVKLDNGVEQKMGLLGRVTLKNPTMVMISFTDNPTVVKNAKLALQKSALTINPQQEGLFLYIQTPKMTRERREQLAKDTGKLLNEYKKALNDTYGKFDRKCSLQSQTSDKQRATRQQLLSLKKAMENRAIDFVEMKKKELLKEIV